MIVFSGITWSLTPGRCAATPEVGSGKGGTAGALHTMLRLGKRDTSLLHLSLEREVKPEL